ncbi:hypothetical protein TNCV_656951 [Trichonephila clavipes]|nr:hypothetical protein TNCV_656951 [Trichonephila clavipes]
MVAYRTSTLQVQRSNSGLGKVDTAFHPFSRSMNEYPACLGKKPWGFPRETDHLIRAFAHVPQHLGSQKLRWRRFHASYAYWKSPTETSFSACVQALLTSSRVPWWRPLMVVFPLGKRKVFWGKVGAANAKFDCVTLCNDLLHFELARTFLKTSTPRVILPQPKPAGDYGVKRYQGRRPHYRLQPVGAPSGVQPRQNKNILIT